jgi:hypothetical protein
LDFHALPDDGRCLAAQTSDPPRPQGGGRGLQQGDATDQAHRLSGAAALPVPTCCSSLGGRPRPSQPHATAVLDVVKVVRPRFAAGAPP